MGLIGMAGELRGGEAVGRDEDGGGRGGGGQLRCGEEEPEESIVGERPPPHGLVAGHGAATGVHISTLIAADDLASALVAVGVHASDLTTMEYAFALATMGVHASALAAMGVHTFALTTADDLARTLDAVGIHPSDLAARGVHTSDLRRGLREDGGSGAARCC
uniref:Uncharacterized protein n=1 Tax=Oryza punctata TaxID=4537 RepID=A0A0E0JI21_ORYPU